MKHVIDTPWNVTEHLAKLRAAGVTTILRYYNHRNSKSLPEKRLERAEAAAIAAAGMSIGVVFQQRGGAGGNISDLNAQSGALDGARALELARRINQPLGSAIYFAVDHDYFRASDLASITDYFATVSGQINGQYRIGVYGSGTVSKTVVSAGHAELIWLPAAKGWSGTKDMLKTDAWALFQHWPSIETPLPHDRNTLSPAWTDFGQFIQGAPVPAIVDEENVDAANIALMEVTARSGLNIRRGAGTEFAVETSLPFGSIVHALGQSGDWVQIDMQGDGLADGHAHADYLRKLAGGFPLSIAANLVPPNPGPSPTTALVAGGGMPSHYDIAKAELALDVREVAGPGNNPRILLYHRSTHGSLAGDDVAWCSSFVNYCVEQSGRDGTDSKWALDWNNWGIDVTDEAREGDIVVFERIGRGGHVAFLVEDLGDRVSILGGNQSNRVRISTYPKDGNMGSTTYRLRSVRRG